MSDARDTVDALEADMAAHQQRFGQEVTAGKNQQLAAQTVEQLETANQITQTPLLPGVATTVPKLDEKREVDNKIYRVQSTGGDDVQTRLAKPSERWFFEHAMPRILLLLEKKESGPLGAPSWEKKVLAVMELKARAQSYRTSGLLESAHEYERRFLYELTKLLEDSSKDFGDWKKDEPRKTYG